MLHRYDPKFKDFYKYVCTGCGAESNAKADLLQHEPCCMGTTTEYVFGPRISRAVVIYALDYGREDKDGLPFSYNELRASFPDAVASAEQSLALLIEERENAKRKKKLSEEIARLEAVRILAKPKQRLNPRKPVQMELGLELTPIDKAPEPKRIPPKSERRNFSPHFRDAEDRSFQSVRSIFKADQFKKLGGR